MYQIEPHKDHVTHKHKAVSRTRGLLPPFFTLQVSMRLMRLWRGVNSHSLMWVFPLSFGDNLAGGFLVRVPRLRKCSVRLYGMVCDRSGAFGCTWAAGLVLCCWSAADGVMEVTVCGWFWGAGLVWCCGVGLACKDGGITFRAIPGLGLMGVEAKAGGGVFGFWYIAEWFQIACLVSSMFTYCLLFWVEAFSFDKGL